MNVSRMFIAVAFLPLFAQPELKIETINDSVHALFGRGGNMALCVGKDGVFLIDDQFAPVTPEIMKVVKSLGYEDVRFVFNTHWHQDHTSGNENFGKSGAVIVAHENVRERMSSDQFIAVLDRQVKASPDIAKPVVTFTRDIKFHLNGEEIEVVHMPHAHTDGDSLVFFKNANIVHMGDTFFNGLYPFIDRSSGGSVNGLIVGLEGVLARIDDETVIIPGHGPLAKKKDLQFLLDMVKTIKQRVSKAIAEGKSLKETQEAGLTKEWDDPYGKIFLTPDQVIQIFYEDLRE